MANKTYAMIEVRCGQAVEAAWVGANAAKRRADGQLRVVANLQVVFVCIKINVAFLLFLSFVSYVTVFKFDLP